MAEGHSGRDVEDSWTPRSGFRREVGQDDVAQGGCGNREENTEGERWVEWGAGTMPEQSSQRSGR